MEAYVDDMLVKSLLAEQYPNDLDECLQTLRQYQMKLNPAKCAFRVTAGKFLGFMVHYRGIEANPLKIKSILEMPPPHKECQEAFEQLKQCLVSPPVLAKPQPGESLYIYLAASDEAVSSILVREEDKVRKPVYYVSKRLAGAEICYTPTEKLAYALVIFAQKLRPYFEAHHVIVLSNQPLRHVLGKSDLSGRMLKWAVELSAFDIDYRPRPAIKAQALADFIVEGTLLVEADEGVSQTWTLFVDGSSSVGGSGAGILLQGPNGQAWPYALHFEFNASNNEAEYEALIAGLRLAEQMGVRDLEVTGEFEAREDAMAQYLAIAKDLMARFQAMKINHVPHAQNAVADALSRIAASSFPRNSRAVYMESLPQRSIETETEQLCVDGVENWMDPIVAHLTNGWLPEDEQESRKLKRQAAKFLLIRLDLYKKSFTQSLLKCVGAIEANYILREIHEGICGSHIGARTILQGLRARVKKAEDRWVDELPNILWSYRTTPRTAIGECPFTLCYGLEALISVEIGVMSYRVEHFDPEVNEQGLRCNLDMMDELRDLARIRQAGYNQRIARYYNRRVHARSLMLGDLVLRWFDVSHPRDTNKLTPNWE
ncbi:uncharacterized protein LOC127809393 [Diospyros lotus]|uniref:uncharacterized protein LOC127809393 n=1 Tax=Diospyros lotus TaxID=55363 RepID=UPI0022530558|nr:uncharacterized protein LOC127809393 [Diospyros lotus]